MDDRSTRCERCLNKSPANHRIALDVESSFRIEGYRNIQCFHMYLCKQCAKELTRRISQLKYRFLSEGD